MNKILIPVCDKCKAPILELLESSKVDAHGKGYLFKDILINLEYFMTGSEMGNVVYQDDGLQIEYDAADGFKRDDDAAVAYTCMTCKEAINVSEDDLRNLITELTK